MKKENTTAPIVDLLSRKEALKKIGSYSKYAALTALGTFILLNSQKAQAQSGPPPPGGFSRFIKNKL
jgi:hypothetical protein